MIRVLVLAAMCACFLRAQFVTIMGAQIFPPTTVVPGNPPGGVGGACTTNYPFYANLITGQLTACHNGVWSIIATGEISVWNKYTMIAIPDGVNGCVNAGNGCWQVNGVLVAQKVANTFQDVFLFKLPANGKVSDWRIKTNKICTGPTIITTGLGTTLNDVVFQASSYSMRAAVSDTNLIEGPTPNTGSGTIASVNVVASIVTAVTNVDQIGPGCAVDYWVQWGTIQ